MNRATDLHDSDESDSDFCPEKEAGIEVSEEEASSELSSCSDEEDKEDDQTKKSKQKVSRKNANAIKKSQAKKLKTRKRARAQNEEDASESDDECKTVDAERKRNTRQTEAAKRLCDGTEKDTLESDEENKSRSDALWADFLSDVKPKTSQTVAKTTATTQRSSTQSNGTSAATTTNGSSGIAKSVEKSNTDEKPTEMKKPEKITVTEVLDFAGEEVRIEKVVNADSVKENKESTKRPAAGTSTLKAGLPAGLKRPMVGGGSSAAGLGSILNQIGKKKKISVLEKSQLDWKSFKQNEGIEEELQTFNKGKDGYLERQDFLQRTDLRQFEIEKNLRQTRRNN